MLLSLYKILLLLRKIPGQDAAQSNFHYEYFPGLSYIVPAPAYNIDLVTLFYFNKPISFLYCMSNLRAYTLYMMNAYDE